ncbi:hypothetical protein B0H16DRAFT_1734507 [Mycena metata]|uniref:Chromatin elongation factor spt5 n=1 Tax=Mycena metata TaxID=1033252 RepID=A0AAD7HW87_9AGAR|nr:hypothetical protein B0H16DRAFT_1734507 [Mycena metata]
MEHHAQNSPLFTDAQFAQSVAPINTPMDIEEAITNEAYYTGSTLAHGATQSVVDDPSFLERAPSPTDPYFTSGSADVELALVREDEAFFLPRVEEPMDVDPDTDPEEYPIGDQLTDEDRDEDRDDDEEEGDVDDEQEDVIMEDQTPSMLDLDAAENGNSSGEDDDIGDEHQDVMIEDQTPVVLDVYAAEGNGDSSGEDDDEDSAEAQARAFDRLHYKTDMKKILQGWTQTPGGPALPNPPSRSHSPQLHSRLVSPSPPQSQSRPTSPLLYSQVTLPEFTACPPSPVMYPIPDSHPAARTPSPTPHPDARALFLGSPTPSRQPTPPPAHDFTVQEDIDQDSSQDEKNNYVERKRAPRRVPATLARFLDLEAQDADGEEEEEETLNDRAFIDDSLDNGPAGSSRLHPTSSSHLFDEDGVDAEQLAAEIVRRYRPEPPPFEVHDYYVDDDEDPQVQPTPALQQLHTLPTVNDPEIYCVFVGRGREFSFLSWLLELAEAGRHTHVHTAFYREDVPGTVFVEARSGCWGRRADAIPAVSLMDRGWYRVARGQKKAKWKVYSGDLVIRARSDVVVVPRLRRRYDDAGWPPKRLFQVELVEDALSVRYGSSQFCKYRDQLFDAAGGLLWLPNIAVVKCTTPPTDEEIEFFCPSYKQIQLWDQHTRRTLAIAAGDMVVVPTDARATYIRGREAIGKDVEGVWRDGAVGVVVRCRHVNGVRFALVQQDYPYDSMAGVDESGVVERPVPHPRRIQELPKAMKKDFPSPAPNPPPAPPPFWITTSLLRHHLFRIPRILAPNDRVEVVGQAVQTVGRVLAIHPDVDERIVSVTLQPLPPPPPPDLDNAAEDNAPNPEPITVPIHHLEMRFMLGDWVEITRSKNAGKQGFIVALYTAGVAEIFNFTIERDYRTNTRSYSHRDAIEVANDDAVTVTIPTNHLKFVNAGKAPLPTVSTPTAIFNPPNSLFPDDSGPATGTPSDDPTHYDHKTRALFSRLFWTGKVFTGREVTVVGNHSLKGLHGRVVGWTFPPRAYKNHKNYKTSYKLAQELLFGKHEVSWETDPTWFEDRKWAISDDPQSWRRKKTGFEGVRVQVQLDRTGHTVGNISDIMIHFLQDRATGLDLQKAAFVPVRTERIDPPRARTPPTEIIPRFRDQTWTGPDPVETPVEKAAREAKPRDEDGLWLAPAELCGKRIDVVLDTMIYSAGEAKKWAERNTQNNGVDGWVTLNGSSLAKGKKLKVRTSPMGHPLNVPPANLRPARTMKQRSLNNSTASIADESTRVIVIGADLEGSIVHRGRYARTLPGAPQAPAAGLVKVQFEILAPGVDGGYGWFPLHSLCRALNKTPSGYDHLKTSAFFEQGVN